MLLCWRFSIFLLFPLAKPLLHKNIYIAILRQTCLNDTYNDWQPAYIEKEHRWPKNLNKLTAFLHVPADSQWVMVSEMCCLSGTTAVIELFIVFLFLHQCTLTSCTGVYVIATIFTSNSYFLRWFDFDSLKFAILKSQSSASSQVTKSFFISVHFPRHNDKTGQHHHKLNIS